ncbi:MAG: hypothetical protein J7K81_01225 [Methanophagales archaeon]|nr:hypothetical protein [Methanophagales archaeon]
MEYLSEEAIERIENNLCLLNDLNEEQKAMFDVPNLMRYKKLVSTKLH